MTEIYKIPLRARFAKYKRALRSGVPQKGAYRLRLVQPVTGRKGRLAYADSLRKVKEQAEKLRNQQFSNFSRKEIEQMMRQNEREDKWIKAMTTDAPVLFVIE